MAVFFPEKIFETGNPLEKGTPLAESLEISGKNFSILAGNRPPILTPVNKC